MNDRSKFLGGSDAAAVLGLSDWATPVELWMEKTGRAPRVADPAMERIYRRGHKLEPFIREMVIEKLTDEGCEVELLAVNRRYADQEHPFLAVEIDFELAITGTVTINNEPVRFEREHVNADAKSVGNYYARKKWGEVGTDQMPIAYTAQFMSGLGVCPGQRQWCLVAALKGFDDVDIYWVRRDDDTIAAIREKMVSFWVDHVLADVPPDPVKFADVRALFPAPTEDLIEADEEIAEKVEQLVRIKDDIKEYEEAADALSLEIGEYIGPHVGVSYQGRALATWKAHQTTRIDVDRLKSEQPDLYVQFCRTSTVRPLRLNKPPRSKQKCHPVQS